MKNLLTPGNDRKPHDLPAFISPQSDFKNILQYFWNMLDFSHNKGHEDSDLRIEVSETENAVRVLAELPGINEKDIDLEVSANGYLTISGERKQQTEHNGKNSYFSEMTYGMIKRTVPLPWDLDFEKADADFDNGVLDITIPKTNVEMQKMKKINLKKHPSKIEN